MTSHVHLRGFGHVLWAIPDVHDVEAGADGCREIRCGAKRRKGAFRVIDGNEDVGKAHDPLECKHRSSRRAAQNSRCSTCRAKVTFGVLPLRTLCAFSTQEVRRRSEKAARAL